MSLPIATLGLYCNRQAASLVTKGLYCPGVARVRVVLLTSMNPDINTQRTVTMKET